MVPFFFSENLAYYLLNAHNIKELKQLSYYYIRSKQKSLFASFATTSASPSLSFPFAWVL